MHGDLHNATTSPARPHDQIKTRFDWLIGRRFTQHQHDLHLGGWTSKIGARCRPYSVGRTPRER
jgi:hypothetical protein